MALQDQVAPRGPVDCDPVTGPVQTPSGAVEYRPPAATVAPQSTLPPVQGTVQPQVMPPQPAPN
jgi:hypothetical protein